MCIKSLIKTNYTHASISFISVTQNTSAMENTYHMFNSIAAMTYYVLWTPRNHATVFLLERCVLMLGVQMYVLIYN